MNDVYTNSYLEFLSFVKYAAAHYKPIQSPSAQLPSPFRHLIAVCV